MLKVNLLSSIASVQAHVNRINSSQMIRLEKADLDSDRE